MNTIKIIILVLSLFYSSYGQQQDSLVLNEEPIKTHTLSFSPLWGAFGLLHVNYGRVVDSSNKEYQIIQPFWYGCVEQVITEMSYSFEYEMLITSTDGIMVHSKEWSRISKNVLKGATREKTAEWSTTCTRRMSVQSDLTIKIGLVSQQVIPQKLVATLSNCTKSK